ncbi:hypothetical protein MRX96_048810 [Rhipicephalus microplus]
MALNAATDQQYHLLDQDGTADDQMDQLQSDHDTDAESYFLLKEQLPEDNSEKKQVCHGVNLYLVSLIAAALGVICCLLIAQFTMSMQSQDVPTTTQYLVEWMRSLNLDLMNETRLATVSPVEIMVRGSLDLGVHVVTSIVIAEKYFWNKKRLIQLSATGGEDKLNYTVDNENLADLVGAKIAYQAFASLTSPERTETLAGLDLSSEQLFFVNYCVVWCAQHSQSPEKYAPFRSRCIVPLMNMPEFSSAFRCATGTLMNPAKKCEFWLK